MGQSNKKTVLIIEDDRLLSKMYSKKFETEGFNVLRASDGEEGLEMARKKPDIILLDMVLPKRSGGAFLAKKREIKDIIHIPVIALTNLADKEQAEYAEKMGVKDYLVKAMHTPEQVVVVVTKCLQQVDESPPNFPPQE